MLTDFVSNDTWFVPSHYCPLNRSYYGNVFIDYSWGITSLESRLSSTLIKNTLAYTTLIAVL